MTARRAVPSPASRAREDLRRDRRRARRLMRRLPAGAAWHRRALEALAAVLRDRSLSGSLLEGPGFRAWLALAEEAAALFHPPRSDRALLDRLARGSHLAEVLPRGRVDAGARRRARRLAATLRDTAYLKLVPLLLFRTPQGRRHGPFPLDSGPDGEEARAAGEVHVEHPVPARARIEPDSRVVMDGLSVHLAFGGPPGPRKRRLPAKSASWRPRPRIPGTPIVVARQVVSTRRGLRPGAHMAGLPDRLRRALDLLEEAWPEAAAQVAARTKVVVPLVERGTVSFSMPSRPGVSYINVAGKSLVDLADDLLHETAHHRLHDLEAPGPLVRDDGEPRYRSPWRRTLRPVRGILHAAFTFSYRAELLRRLVALPRQRRLPRAWMRRELAFERRALRKSLADLDDARAGGLLTTRGAAVARRLASRHRSLW